jgi:hypothetical protein
LTGAPEEILPTGDDEILEQLREALGSTANRMIHPVIPGEQQLIALLEEPGTSTEILRSHAITSEASAALQQGDILGFFQARMIFMNQHMKAFLESRARWEESDRPSLQSLIVPEED